VPHSWYVFALPQYVQRLFLLYDLGIKNPILMDQTLEDYNLGLRVTGRLTYGPKPGAIDKD